MSLAPSAAAGVELAPGGWATRSVRFEPVDVGTGLTVAGSGTYRGAVEVRRNGAALAVINDVGLEDYVKGIDEVPASWPAAALQAQAIAARTYALHKAVVEDTSPWRAVGADICTTATCQVYRGMAVERRAGTETWLAAVDATAGLVLLSGGRPIFAGYSATVNGPSAMSQNGAYAMALEGRSAADILASYYGVRPSLPPGAQLPSSIRVALVTSTRSVKVSSTGSTRVSSADGSAVTAAGGGEWTLEAGAAGVELRPPASSLRSLSVADAAPAPQLITAGRPARVITAGSALPRRGPWPALVAVGLLLAVGGSAGAAGARRRRL